jgi:two-component sensor histidine kinase
LSVQTPIITAEESLRMAAVRRYDILDTPPDGSFDRITALAARLFDVPISIISIVDHDRIWFKSHHGLDVKQIGRDAGLCASAILSPEPWLLPDAAKDVRSLANPLVAGDFGLRFYAGVPLTTHDGHSLGTLCVIDREPRAIAQRQVDDLKDLASVVMDQLELRLSARRAVAHAEIMGREIEHRVMNSLQFVSGILSLQSRAASEPEAQQQLTIAANRVAAIGRVHRNFGLDDPSDAVACLPYLRRLCADLSGLAHADIEVNGTDADIPASQILPIGLIVNELVTNAAKHGTGRGKIKVELARAGGGYKLSVCDDGDGLPPSFDPAQTRGLGMKIVLSLAKQMSGKLTATANPAGKGACFAVRFGG